MKNTFEKTYLTGEFAKLLEINKDTLLYYDKIDLFKPAGTFDNGYRYYTFEQFDQFVAIQSLRAVEVPIKELKTYFDAPNVQALQQLAMEQQEKVAMEIQKLQDIQFFLERTVALTKEMEEVSIGEVLVKQLPAEPVVYSDEKIDWSSLSMEELYEQTTPFLKKLGIKSTAAYGTVYTKGDFLNKKFEGVSYLFCRLDDPSARMKPAGHYVVIYHQGPYDEISQTETYNTLLAYLEQEQLALDGDIYEEYLLHSIAAKEEKDYITKISVKVKTREASYQPL
ncbi:MerR family transcriptional regulator [Paenibacillus jamilae]|uniref:MerR family transcriptional regulator n=1 Tax=Paenibacillus jamilae TaxID=114136 RepID=A0ACC4ZY13_9BACL|nr:MULTISPECIES: MerR family transcriptional regulator [Paenibacillus]AJE50673.1 MerR family transcriptional regulator [Paenibacillus polymyxa]AUO05441.1 MerR family DNA-binding transcriptional regulator [Paenibacillus sp. lzh-N1]KTS83633.1 MerR family transcriptional regulator [Paenibacillus jamilae]MBU9707230.1 MerR family transcriptional regulator [Paenibacillus sp. AK121]MEE4566195.1 MerR family transcriptional regulator [Paenibacillus polymyxa]